MFVRSLMNKDAVYRKGGFDWVIKANTVTFIDESRVTAKELKSLYGSRILIVSRDSREDKEVQEVIEKKEAPLFVKQQQPELDEKLIDEIIQQIEDEKNKKDEKEAEKLAKAKAEAEEKAKAEAEKLAKEKAEAEVKAKATNKPKATGRRRGRRKSIK